MSSSVLEAHATAMLARHEARGVSARGLAKVLGAASLNRMSDGETLCAEGEPGLAMYFLIDGAITVRRKDASGELRELAVVEAPAMVGHMALMDNSSRSASCFARGRTVVAALDRGNYNRIVAEPSVRGTALRRVLLSSLARQMVTANDRIRDLVAESEPKAKAKVADVPTRTARDEQDELLKIAGVLDGWKIDERQLKAASKVKVAYTDEQLRNRKSGLGGQ